jgi:lysyl-tRNA synthetase class 1
MSVTETAASLRELAEHSNAWPFEEARKIVMRLKKQPKEEVIFETGYGPSGLPHIGTFGEVARTTMVRHAFRVLTDDKIKTRLIAFPTTWMACARCRTTCRTRRCWRAISASR